MKNKTLSIIAMLLCLTMLIPLSGCEKPSDNEEEEVEEKNEDKDEADKDENGKEEVQGEYKEGALFSFGLAPLKKDGKVGYVNEKGKFVIKAKFDDARPFGPNGLAAAQYMGAWGYIDTKGEFVIEPSFSDAYDFDKNGVAHVFAGGYHGFINEKGQWVIENKYTYINEFDEIYGLASASLKTDEYTYSYGYINRAGEMVIDALYDEAYAFAPNGVARVYKDGEYSYIDTKGNTVLTGDFRFASDFGSNGLAFVSYSDSNESGYITVDGTMAISIGKDKALTGEPFDENGIGKVYAYGKCRFVRGENKPLEDVGCQEVREFDENGIAVAQVSLQQYNFITLDGKLLLSESCRMCSEFSYGLARVKTDDRWGYVDLQGNQVIDCQFYTATDFYSDGYAIVGILNGEEVKYAIIDKEGNYLVGLK